MQKNNCQLQIANRKSESTESLHKKQKMPTSQNNNCNSESTKRLQKKEIAPNQQKNNCQLSIVNCQLVCVAGKMAAGKNFVCSLLEKKLPPNERFVSVDADILVHKAIEVASSDILNAFSEEAKNAGIELKNPDGSLNRRAIGKLVFPRPDLLKKQEEIVYPIVIKLTRKFVENARKENPNARIAINATVAYKTPEILEMCDSILFVTAPFFTRLKRAKKRDNLSIRQILARFKSQRNLYAEYKKTGIPVVKINDSGSEEKILKKLEKFYGI